MRILAAVVTAALLLAGCGVFGDGGLSAGDLDGAAYTSTEVTGHDLVEGTTLTLTFEDGRMSAAAGCNTQGAAYEVEDGTLRWTQPASSTLIGCPDALAAQDQWVAGLFTDGISAALDGSTLTLTSDDVTLVLESG